MREFFFGNEPIEWVQELFGLGHPLPFRIFSLLGDTWGMLLVVGLTLWLWGRRPAYALIGIVVAGAGAKLLSAMIFQQTRPQGPEIVVYEQLEISSFPSGHVFEAIGPWGLLWLMGHLSFWVAAVITVTVSVGRLYLGVHYVGDVLAAIAFGIGLVWLYWKALPTLGRWFAQRPRSFFVGLILAAVAGTVMVMWLAGGDLRRHEIYGIMIASALALPLERRLPPYEPAASPAGGRLLRFIIGTAGIAAFLLWSRSQTDQALLLGTLAAGLASVWTILLAPMVFRAIELGGTTPVGSRIRPDDDPDRKKISGRV